MSVLCFICYDNGKWQLNDFLNILTPTYSYGSNLMHTYACPSATIIVNPIVELPNMYNERLITLFKGGTRHSLPPHIYTVTQNAYRTMLSSARSQTVVFGWLSL